MDGFSPPLWEVEEDGDVYDLGSFLLFFLFSLMYDLS
jgi:hypothetical protein